MMKKHGCAGWGLLILRVVLGLAFFMHGLDKVQGIEGVIGFFGSIGLPAFVAWAVAIGEILAGALLVLGIFTRIAGYMVAVIMFFALILVKMKMQNGVMAMELELIFLAAGLAIAWVGPGRFSLGHRIGMAMRNKDVCDNCHACSNGGCNSHEEK